MKAAGWALAMLWLSGCSQVLSRGPLFDAAATAERPRPRPGLWVEVCPDSPETTAETGDCGRRLAIAPGRVAELERASEGPPEAARAGAFRIIRGDPLIVELRRDHDSTVEYGWLRDLGVDRRGVATRFTVHAVACRINRSGSVLFGTRGMEDDITDNVDFDRGADGTGLCYATTADQVRRAARLNRQGQGDSAALTFRFERDEPGLERLVAVRPAPPPPAIEPAPAPAPEPVTDPEPGPAFGDLIRASLAAAAAAALAYIASGLAVRGRWRWWIKPAAGLIGGYAAVALLQGPAALPALLWAPLLPVAALLFLDRQAPRRSVERP